MNNHSHYCTTQKLKWIKNFEYLGVNFNDGNDQEVEINRCKVEHKS